MHQGVSGEVELQPEEESLGTLVWLGLIGPLVAALSAGSVLLADELDASLHPALVQRVIELFQQPETNPHRAQLIFNSHDPTILGDSRGHRLLGRDQTWFTEKRVDGSTRLFPLLDLDPRKHEAVGGRYLEGRYGATPIISGSELDRVGELIAADRRLARPSRPPRRSVSSGPQPLRLLAFVEGLRTEEDYLKHLWRPRREHVILVIDEFRGTPMALVERAVRTRSANSSMSEKDAAGLPTRSGAYSTSMCIRTCRRRSSSHAGTRSTWSRRIPASSCGSSCTTRTRRRTSSGRPPSVALLSCLLAASTSRATRWRRWTHTTLTLCDGRSSSWQTRW